MSKGETVLVAEDNPDDFALFQRAALKCGISAAIHHVSDGHQAIEYLHGVGPFADREKYPLPKIMVLDLKMPGVNGFDFLSWRMNHETHRCLPVLVLSSSGEKRDVERAFALGANSYAVKPASFNVFVEQVAAFHDWWINQNVVCHLPN